MRYFNAAGAEPTAEIGEDHNPETHLIPLVLDVALGIRPEVQILGRIIQLRTARQLRDYVHVCDLARAHVLAVKYLLDHRRTIAVNLGSGHGISVRQVIDTAQEVTGCPIRAKQTARRPGDPAELVADPRKARDLLGWSAERSNPKTIIADAWRWHAQRFGRNGRQ